MAAFTGFPPPLSPDVQGVDPFNRRAGRYGNYDITPLQGLAPPSSAPAAPAVASRGALQGAPPAGGAPLSAFSPGTSGKGAGEARKPPKNQFFDMWKDGDDKDRDEVAAKQEEVFAQKGLSLEGATKMLFDQGGEVAAEIGRQYGLVPPEDKAGMPAFKTTEAAVADMEGARKKRDTKLSKRRAMGGFLMEMGLRILSSKHDDVGGAIGEGALSTIDARRQRKEYDEAKGVAAAERARKARLEERAQTIDERGASVDERRAAAEEERAAAATKQAETARIEAEKDPAKSRTPFSFEIQRDIYMEAFLPDDPTDEQKKQVLQDFLEWESGQSKLTVSQKENIVSKYIKEINDAPRSKQPQGWRSMSLTEKRHYVVDSVPGLSDIDSRGDDPLGLGI